MQRKSTFVVRPVYATGTSRVRHLLFRRHPLEACERAHRPDNPMRRRVFRRHLTSMRSGVGIAFAGASSSPGHRASVSGPAHGSITDAA